MSWIESGMIIQVATPESEYRAFLESLEFENVVFKKKLAFDLAVSAGGIAIASIEGWTILWGALALVAEERLRELSTTANIFVFLISEKTSSYMFEWWTNGTQKRKRFIEEMDNNPSLPEEIEAFQEEDDDESRFYAIMEKLTLPFRTVRKPKYHVFNVKDELVEVGDDDGLDELDDD